MTSRLEHMYNLWTEEAWQAFIHQPETGLFVNINKVNMNERHQLPN